MPKDRNQKLYRAPHMVQHYTQLKLLQPAEQAILDLLRDRLPQMRMLDIGVGGGRTTLHFSKWVLEYVGIDYSAPMIAACQRRFATPLKPPTFRVCDARDLSLFEDNSFDFILFSFNGIDYGSHCDRQKCLQEVRRVGKPGGYFCFSSHNLQSMEQAFDWHHQLSLNPLTAYVNLAMWGLLRLCNTTTTLKQLHQSTHAIIKDESHNFQLNTYYIRPQAQVQQLQAHFEQISVYSGLTGLEIVSEQDLHLNVDQWLYYLCRLS